MTKSWGLPSYGAPLLGVRQRQGLQVKSERNAEGQRGPTVQLEIEGSGLPTDPTLSEAISSAGAPVGATLARPAVQREAPTAPLGYVQTWFAIGPSR